MMQHTILQAYPTKDFCVYLYFNDGRIKKFDATQLVMQGVFKPLADIELFMRTCTVMNHTLAWDLLGKRNPYECLDLDAEHLYATCPVVKDPLETAA